MSTVPSETVQPDVCIRRLEETLEGFDDAGGHQCLGEVFDRFGVEDALSLVVMPYLKGVGDRWEAGTIGVGQEHFASNVIRGRLANLMHTEAPAEGPLAVLACMPNEQHEFGLMATALALSELGWRTCYLGANTPVPELVRTCGRVHPDAVVLAARRETAYAAHAPALRHLAASHRVFLGASGATSDMAALCDAVQLDADPVTGAELVHAAVTAADRIEAARADTHG